LSKKFAKTLEEKYGLSGKKGQSGETFFIDFYKAKGYSVIYNDDDIVLQSKGIDVTIVTSQGSYTVDVKNNLTADGRIVVEIDSDGWLFNPKKKSEYISHVNTLTKKIVTYKRDKMKKYIEYHYWDLRSKFIYLPISELSFVKVEEGTKI